MNQSNGLFPERTTHNEEIKDKEIYLLNTSALERICTNVTIDSLDLCVTCILINILLVACLIAMLVNIIVILSVYWIRSPMTPNLKISLSLAAADACSSTMSGIFLLLEGYVPDSFIGVLPSIIEVLRLSGIVITVVHLLALSLNHYIGIMKPLHYNSIVTNRKVSAVISLLWLCPTIVVISICAAYDSERTFVYNLIHNTNRHAEFMDTFAFRMSYASLFLVPIVMMVFSYTHILIVVRKQQNRWNTLARSGSGRCKGRSVTTSCSTGSHKLHKEKKQLEGNVRAIYTTLLILGSCFVGWSPALLFYILTCPVGCYIEGEELRDLNCNYTNIIMVLRLIENMLIILKMLLNPIIYSIRMREIKDGKKRMLQAAKWLFCPWKRDLLRNNFPRSRTHNSVGTGTVRMTSFKFVNGNTNVSIGKDVNNTFL